MGMTDFWAEIDAQLEQVRQASTVDEVLAACPPIQGTSVGAGFFAGSGGDESIMGALDPAKGWRFVRIAADYYWVAQDANGDFLAYTEGDMDKGDNPACGR
jgi:hypothetical protein